MNAIDPEERKRRFARSKEQFVSSNWNLTARDVDVTSSGALYALVAQSKAQRLVSFRQSFALLPQRSPQLGWFEHEFNAEFWRNCFADYSAAERLPDIDSSLGIMTSLVDTSGSSEAQSMPVTGFFTFRVTRQFGPAMEVVCKVKPWEDRTAVNAAVRVYVIVSMCVSVYLWVLSGRAPTIVSDRDHVRSLGTTTAYRQSSRKPSRTPSRHTL